MVYTVDRAPEYNLHKSERDQVRRDIQNPDANYSESGFMRLYRYMIHRADDMSYYEELEWETQD